MMDNISYEDVMRDAARTGESVKAALHYMSDLIDMHNEECVEGEEVDPVSAMMTAGIRFIKPSGGIVAGFMSQFGVLFVQVVPVDATSMLGHVLEQGYHVIPNQYLESWKAGIKEAHAETLNMIIEDYNTPDEEEVADDASAGLLLGTSEAAPNDLGGGGSDEV